MSMLHFVKIMRLLGLISKEVKQLGNISMLVHVTIVILIF